MGLEKIVIWISRHRRGDSVLLKLYKGASRLEPKSITLPAGYKCNIVQSFLFELPGKELLIGIHYI